ncbi:MAG: RHS repeat-associated core domain-containing protein, partial [Acidimicrobiia bacterium]
RDESSGTVSVHRYLPFGDPRGSSAPTVTDHTYTGQIADASTDLMFYNARYYDPGIGRFISPDSIVPSPGNPQNFNRYSYVRNNPVNYTDPTGHCGITDLLDCGEQLAGLAVDVAEVSWEFYDAVFDGSEAIDAVDEGFDRGWEYGEFLWDRAADMGRKSVTDPQNTIDITQGTFFLEQLAGLTGTLVAGGNTDLTNCPDIGTCIVDTGFPPGFGAITLGHTVLVNDRLEPDVGVHEYQHILDIEQLGGVAFYGLYLADYAILEALGRDGYSENMFEERADATQQSYIDSGGTSVQVQPKLSWR